MSRRPALAPRRSLVVCLTGSTPPNIGKGPEQPGRPVLDPGVKVDRIATAFSLVAKDELMLRRWLAPGKRPN